MPLSSTGSYPFYGPRNVGVGVTMRADASELIVYVRLEDLRKLAQDPHESSIAVFRRHLASIEGAACRKFDAQGRPANGLLLIESKDFRLEAEDDLLAARFEQIKQDLLPAMPNPALELGRQSKAPNTVESSRKSPIIDVASFAVFAFAK